ncbi:MAG: hypothetical protein ACI9TH_002269 [Kiritimatiellia bacterium]|jgi:hypothetical protein
MRSSSLILTLLVLLTAGCGKKQAVDSGSIESEPLAARGTQGATLYERIAPEQSGLDFMNAVDPDHPDRRLYATSMACGGVTIGDVNGDGRPDLFLTSGADQNRLYLQTADFTFEDATEKSGIEIRTVWSTGASIADIDNDGDLDIYVCNYDDLNSLLINQGVDAKGIPTFVDEAKSRKAGVRAASLTPALADYDGDGDLDIFILTSQFTYPGGTAATAQGIYEVGPKGRAFVLPKYNKFFRMVDAHKDPETENVIVRLDEVGDQAYLLENEGEGWFKDATLKSGLRLKQKGVSVLWVDYNRDGYPDLFLGNDANDPDQLFHNNGDGTFTEKIDQAFPHVSWYTRGADIGDLDGDGQLDFITGDIAGETHFTRNVRAGLMVRELNFLQAADPKQHMKNTVLLNTGSSRYLEAAYLTGMGATDSSWSVNIADMDNDGRDDVFFSNGMTRPFLDSDKLEVLDPHPGETLWDRHERLGSLPLIETNQVFQNLGDLQFKEQGEAWGLDLAGMSYASAHADLDGDGDLDLVVMNMDEPVALYRNTGNTGNRLMLSLKGTSDHPQGIGAHIEVRTDTGRTHSRQMFLNHGFNASRDAVAHFGLGEAARIRELVVSWPAGHRQVFTDLEPNQHYTVTQPAGAPPDQTPVDPPAIRFTEYSSLQLARHNERDFNDFGVQPSLPYMLSRQGPALATGDVDGDGDLDIVLGGAKGFDTQLILNEGNGRYRPGRQTALGDREREDTGLLLFDADSDGDQDLYVVSGGAENIAGAPTYQDKLYLNNGTGTFIEGRRVVPTNLVSGSSASCVDFDRDGDLDLFIGGRVVPAAYPTVPASALLQNDGGVFTDVTDTRAPGLLKTGMITASLFTDIDNDGWLDLLLACDWGPIQVWRNQEGTFTNVTRQAGTDELHGLWTSVTGRDLDGDGDIDYVLGNIGLNSAFPAHKRRPQLLFYATLENNAVHMIQGYFEGDRLLPVQGIATAGSAMPSLFRKYKAFRDYAKDTLPDIYGPELLKSAKRLTLNTVETGCLINDGTGAFTFTPLPLRAQISSVQGIVVTELNGDALPDLILAQNQANERPFLPQKDGGSGMLLYGRGEHVFEAIDPVESGILMTGNGRSMVVEDFDGDGFPDVLSAVNDDHLKAYRGSAGDKGRLISIQLEGPKGNLSAIGSRVTLVHESSQQTAEVYGGEGYLSQSSGRLWFGLPEGASGEWVIRWPNGETSKHLASQAPLQQIKQP